MTLTELEVTTREWLDDPHGEHFEQPRLRVFINAAYSEIATIVGESKRPWYVTLASEAFTFTPVADVRETKIFKSGVDIRRIYDVADERTTNNLEPIEIIPYADRLRKDYGVYVFRATDGFWYVGFVSMPTLFTKLHVRSVLMPKQLSGNSQVPEAVPYEHHLIITYRAALLAKGAENREMRSIASLYVEALNRLRGSLDTTTDQFTAKRLSR